MYGKQVHVNTGSAKPEKPVSKRTDGPAGGHGPGSYSPSSAASHLAGQANCAPHNDGPVKKAVGSKSIA